MRYFGAVVSLDHIVPSTHTGQEVWNPALLWWLPATTVESAAWVRPFWIATAPGDIARLLARSREEGVAWPAWIHERLWDEARRFAASPADQLPLLP